MNAVLGLHLVKLFL